MHLRSTEDFSFHIPGGLKMEEVGPLMCAGATTYSPLKHLGCEAGNLRVGVIGLGGLGHMAVRLAAAWGNKVTVISTKKEKEPFARELGASDFVCSKDEDELKKRERTLDVIIDTVSAKKNMTPYIDMLVTDGKLCNVGLPANGGTLDLDPFALNRGRRHVLGSSIASNVELEAMLKLCADKHIVPHIKVIKPQDVNQALDELVQPESSVRGRFVIDLNNY